MKKGSGFIMVNGKAFLKRVIYTFSPRIILSLSPFRNRLRDYWVKQDLGDPHGYNYYDDDDEVNRIRTQVLVAEISQRVAKDGPVLDLGCNCGRDLFSLKKAGFKKLTGSDICGNAIAFGKKRFDLSGVELITGSHEEVLPRFLSEGRKFDLVYSGGTNISSVHPSFDVVKYICSIAKKYVIFMNEHDDGFAYPRFWDHEFKRSGFILVKFARPVDGRELETANGYQSTTLAVYRRAGETGKK